MDSESGRRVDVLDALKGFDNARWSVACRHMQLRIIHGNLEAAVGVLRTFYRFTGNQVATMGSALASVLPVRIANALEEAGYLTVASVVKATDEELLAIRNFGLRAVATIRSMQFSVERGVRIEQFDEDQELLDESLFIKPCDIQIFNQPMERQNEMTNAEQVIAAINTLAASPDTATEVIDSKIKELEAEVAKFKRLRKMVGNSNSTPGAVKSSEAYIAIGDLMIKILKAHGPLKPARIADALKDGTTYITVGRVVSSDRRFVRRTDGLIEIAKH